MKNTGKKFLSDIKLHSDYLKWKDDIGRYETWVEACESILDGHRQRYAGVDIEEELGSALESMKDMKLLASQRNLQFRYESIKKHNMKLFNCCTIHVCRPRVFQEIFYMLLCGSGLGASLLRPFVYNLPKISKRSESTKTFVIQDSIEGWSDAIGVLMSSYFDENQPFPEYSSCKIRFDYSLIRPKGSYISGGFKAPGSDGLKLALEKIESLIDKWIDTRGNVVEPILAYDVICHISDSVLSGGLRRSALSMIVDSNDEEMILAKTGNWRQENPQRARSNNSVLLLRSEVSKEQFEKLVALNEGDNDIGFVFGDNHCQIFNPCFHKDTKILTSKGWFSFEQLIKIQDSGEDIFVAQDSRINGSFDNNQESWSVDKSKSGIIYNKIGKVGMTGKNVEILEIETTCGRSVKCTKNHKFFTLDGRTVNAENLIPGKDKLLIECNKLFTPNKDSIDFNLGLVAGLIFGDGYNIQDSASGKNSAGISLWFEEDSEENDKILLQIEKIVENVISDAISKNVISSDGYKPLKQDLEFKLQTQVGNSIKYTLYSAGLMKLMKSIGFFNKDNVDFLFNKSKDFQSGFIYGMIFTDGSIEYGKKSQTISVRISQSNKKVLQDISIIMQDLGYISRLYKMRESQVVMLPDSNREYKEYQCKDSYRLVINGFTQCSNLLNTIFVINDYKKEKLTQSLLLSQKEKSICRWTNIRSIKELPREDVYCLEENVNRTLIANGITAARCFEIGMTPINTFEELDSISYLELADFCRKNIDLFGSQQCNLCEINAEKIKTKEDFLRVCKDATIIGTLQAGYTDFPYMTKATEDISRREALLGVSITGWMNNPKIFSKEWLNEGAEVCKLVNKELAKKIGINQAARITTTKPSGNASVILGTSSGIHPEHAEKYFRVMQINKESEVAKYISKNMPFLLEESVWSANKTDYVIFIPIQNSPEGLFKDSMKGVKHLEFIKMAQEEWVNKGKNEDLCISKSTSHNVSNTVIIDNARDVVDYIWNNKDVFAAVSFISDFGDKDFNQAPFTSVLSAEEVFEQYGKGALFASGLIVDGLHYFEGNLWQACDCALDKTIPVVGTREQVLLKKSWLDRAKKFAKNYFKGDMKKMVYCLKDVHLSHKWETINRQMKDVDFSKILPKPEYVSPDKYAGVACSGSSCEITRI